METKLEAFINKANVVHNNLYNYTKSVYKNNKTKLVIICPIHGEFEQAPNPHLTGCGCKKCYIERNTKTQGQFLEEAEKLHGYIYDYSKTRYTKDAEKVTITCNLHGDFKQLPTNHLQGQGCLTCSRIRTASKRTKTTEQFIETSIKIHGNRYDYTKTIYTKDKGIVDIICKEHGVFKQKPNNHTQGAGCPKCGEESHWKRSDYVKKAKGRESTLYIIKCSTQEEEFYKIGITFQKVSTRFNNTAMPYNYEIIYEYKSDAETVWNLEKEYHKKYKSYKYQPSIYFRGHTECFSLNLPIEKIIK